MAKRFCNRKADEFKALLEAWGFKWENSNGDDAIYFKADTPIPIKVPIRNEDIPNGTADYIKRCLIKDGYTRQQILDWWKQNGYEE